MAAHKRWNFLAAVGISALMLAANACSEDTTDNKGNNTGGDGDTGDGDKGNGDGDGDSTVKPVLGEDVAGKACKTKADCGSDAKANCASVLTGGTLPGTIAGLIGIDLDFSLDAPGGYCTAACKATAECGEGAVCFGTIEGGTEGLGLVGGLFGNLTGECRPTCSNNDDCRTDYECAEVNTAGLSGLGGGGGGGGGGLAIDFSSFIPVIAGAIPKTCQPKPSVTPVKDGTVGTACSADSDCDKGTCLGAQAATDTAEAVQGSCTATCSEDSDCGSNGACLGQIYGSRGQCAEKCDEDADCKRADEGFTCADLFGTKTCLPPEPTTPEGDAGTEPEPDASVEDPDAGV